MVISVNCLLCRRVRKSCVYAVRLWSVIRCIYRVRLSSKVVLSVIVSVRVR